MPRVQLPFQDSIARMVSDNTLKTSLEERPSRKIFWNDEFDSLIDLPTENAHPSISRKPLCLMRMSMATETNCINRFGESIPSVGQRAAPLGDDCFVPGFSEGFDNIWVVACLLLLVDVALIAGCLRLRLWRVALHTRHDRLDAA